MRIFWGFMALQMRLLELLYDFNAPVQVKLENVHFDHHVYANLNVHWLMIRISIK